MGHKGIPTEEILPRKLYQITESMNPAFVGSLVFMCADKIYAIARSDGGVVFDYVGTNGCLFEEVPKRTKLELEV